MSEVSGAGQRVAARDALAARARRLTGAAWRFGPEQVGLRGMSLLAVAGLVGVVLAVHGYGHGAVIAAGPGGVGAPAPAAASHTRPAARRSHARSTAGSHARARAKSHAASSSSKAASTKAKAASSAAPSQKLGPLLSSTQYAPYSYQVYPGPESSRARLATAGFTIQVTPHTGTIDLSVSASGTGQQAQTSSFPAGDRIYFVEATFGDDSGGADYNFGDDGVVVTNAHGHVVQ